MSQSEYATADETAAVITRKATPNETWLEAQLQRINPYLGDTGSGDGLRETELLAYQLRDEITTLKGEANVMRILLEKCLDVIATIDPDDHDEAKRLKKLTDAVKAVTEAVVVRT
jgi:hypothetical protein